MAIGGWMWGGADEAAAIGVIHERCRSWRHASIDTAPAYHGFGGSEEIVGKALAEKMTSSARRHSRQGRS